MPPSEIKRSPHPIRIAGSYESVLPVAQADGEVFVNTFAALSRRGHDVTLITPAEIGRATPPTADILDYYGTSGDLRVVEIAGTNQSVVTQMSYHAAAVVRHSAARGADVFYVRNPLTLLFALRAGLRCFYDHYRPWGDQVPPLAPLLRRAMTHPNFLGGVIHSELSRQSYLRIGVPAGRLIVAHNGYDPSRLEPRLTPEQAREKLGFPASQKTVVYTGRVDDSKGLEVLIDAAERMPEVGFMLVGARGESEVRTRAEALPNVRVIGWLAPSELPVYLHAADVLVIPPSSRPLLEHGHTVLPLKVFLYLGAGRAILAPDNPDVAEVLHHGESAHLVDPREPDATTTGLAALLSDDAYRQRLASNAAKQSEGLTWDSRALRIENHLLSRYEAHLEHGGVRVAATTTWPPKGFAKDLGRWFAGLPAKRWTLPPRGSDGGEIDR